MKTLFRLFFLAIMLSGWAVAALCVEVIRMPDPDDATKSKFVVLPKERLGILDTYIDARGWTQADVAAHSHLIARMADAGMSRQLQFLVDPRLKQDAQTQIFNLLKNLQK